MRLGNYDGLIACDSNSRMAASYRIGTSLSPCGINQSKRICPLVKENNGAQASYKSLAV